MAAIARLSSTILSPEEELERFRGDAAGAGAVVSFVGVARAQSRSGATVTGLFLDHHPRLTLTSLETIAGAATERFGLDGALIVHRCGAVAPGEPIVLAAATAAHRRAAFEAVDYMMDRLKSEAVFWKREDGPAGSIWIEPTGQDRSDLSRWSEACPE